MDLLQSVIIILLVCYIAYLYVGGNRKNKNAEPAVPEEPKKEQNYPYMHKNLLTKTEYTFFRVMKDFCKENDLLFCPKVRMEDFLYVTDKKNHSKYRGYIKSRHVDFMLCDSNLHILCGIELDDRSHDSAKAKQVDEFKNRVFEQIKIPLFRVKTSADYREELDKIYKELKVKKGE